MFRAVHTQFSKTDIIDAARSETIQRIAAYVKDNPETEPEDFQSKVVEEIGLFELKLKRLGV